MELVSSTKSTAFELLPPLAPDFQAQGAANDARDCFASDPSLHDLNRLLAEVARRVTKVRPGITQLEFNLDPDIHDVVAAPDLLAFVVGGVLTHQVQGIEVSERGIIRVTTASDDRTTTILLLANSPPALDAVRALEDPLNVAKARGGDPIVLHCRRILEEFGGSLELHEQDGLVGFELSFPKMPVFAPAYQIRPLPAMLLDNTVHKYCMAK